MELTQEKENVILRKLLKGILKKTPVSLNEVKREIGNISKTTGETKEDVAEVLGSIYSEAVSDTFNPENFAEKKK